MHVRNWAEGLVLIELSGGTGTGAELADFVRWVRSQGDCDVVVDFAAVTVLTSRLLAPLLQLRSLLESHNRRLWLCSLDDASKGVLSVTGLDDVFDATDDRAGALSAIQGRLDSIRVE